MSSSTSLVPVRASELAQGQVAPWPIYNEAGELLLARGTVIETQGQLECLIKFGLYRNGKWISEPDTESVPLPQSMDVLRQAAGKRRRAPAAYGKESVVDIADVRWRMGDVLWLQPELSPAVRYGVNLIGSISGKSILVTAPVKDGKLVYLREGEAFIVRSLAGRRAYAFGTKLLKYQQSPHHYLHLSVPKDVRCTVIRRDVRVDVTLSAFLTGAADVAGIDPFAIEVTDISVGGVSGIGTRAAFAKDAIGRLRFRLHAANEDHNLDLAVVVRATEGNAEAGTVRYGLEFTGLTPQEHLVLSAFIFQTVSEQD